MKRIMQAAAVVAALTAQASAGDFDGSKLLICATLEASECSPGLACEKAGRPDDLGAPIFIRIDIEKRVMIGPQKTSPIVSIERSPEQILLQGTELGYAWSIALDQEDGSMAASLVGRNGIFVLFGQCTPL